MLAVVRLFDPNYAAGRAPGEPAGVVVALVETTREYFARFRDRDGAMPADLRLWGCDLCPGVKVGDPAVLAPPAVALALSNAKRAGP
jgi:hypothetical protein